MDSVWLIVVSEIGDYKPSRKKTKVHIDRNAFAFLDDVRGFGRPTLLEGERWDDRVDPDTGDFVMTYAEYLKGFHHDWEGK